MLTTIDKAIAALVLAMLAHYVPDITESTTLEELVRMVIVAVGVWAAPNKPPKPKVPPVSSDKSGV